MKEFKGFTIQSTISDSAHSDYEEMVDAVSNSKELVDSRSNPNSDPNVVSHTSDGNYATDTTNRNYAHKLLANREIPAIIQCVIPPVHEATADAVSTCGGDFHALRIVLSEDIVTGTAPSAAPVFKDPPVVQYTK